MTDGLLDEVEQTTIARVGNAITSDRAIPADHWKRHAADILVITKDLHQRARIAVRDERYKWRNLLVDILEEYEHGNGRFDNAEALAKYIYEQITIDA